MFNTTYAKNFIKRTNDGFRKFVGTYFVPQTKTADEIISASFNKSKTSPIHLMEEKVIANLHAAYRFYELYDIIRTIMQNNEVEEYFAHPYPTSFDYSPDGLSAVIHWESAEDQEYFKLSIGIITNCTTYADSEYNITIQYVDLHNKTSWASGYVDYTEATITDLTDFKDVFKLIRK